MRYKNIILVLLWMTIPSVSWADYYGSKMVNKWIGSEIIENYSTGTSQNESDDKTTEQFSKMIVKYRLMNLYDGNEKTAWCDPYPGDAIGLGIEISLAGDKPVKGIRLINGYTKSAETFKNNNRLKEIKMIFSDGTFKKYKLKDLETEQILPFGKETKGNIKLEILSVYKGAKYSDTCLSELRLVTNEDESWPPVAKYYMESFGGCCVGPNWYIYKTDGTEVVLKGKDIILFGNDVLVSPSEEYIAFGTDITNNSGLTIVNTDSKTKNDYLLEYSVYPKLWVDNNLIVADRCIGGKQIEKFEFDVSKAKIIKTLKSDEVKECE